MLLQGQGEHHALQTAVLVCVPGAMLLAADTYFAALAFGGALIAALALGGALGFACPAALRFMPTYNRLYAAASGAAFATTLLAWSTLLPTPGTPQLCSDLPDTPLWDAVLGFVFWSRVLEGVDLFGVRFAVRARLPAHFVFHHATTLSLAAAITQARAAWALPFVTSNQALHSIAYLYHAGAKSNGVFKFCRFVGHLQLALGIGGALLAILRRVYTGTPCGTASTLQAEVWFLSLNAAYLTLFRHDVNKGRV